MLVLRDRGRALSSSAPPEKGRSMTGRRTLYLPALIVASVLMACAAAVLAVSKEAEATFPGKNGKIAYENNRVIYTVKPDGGG
jgi:hypothetical protein